MLHVLVFGLYVFIVNVGRMLFILVVIETHRTVHARAQLTILGYSDFSSDSCADTVGAVIVVMCQVLFVVCPVNAYQCN